MQEKSKVEIVEIDIESEINAQWINALELRTLKNAFDLFSTEKQISKVEKTREKTIVLEEGECIEKETFLWNGCVLKQQLEEHETNNDIKFVVVKYNKELKLEKLFELFIITDKMEGRGEGVDPTLVCYTHRYINLTR